MRSAGGIKLSGFFMKQLEKKYFPSYDEAQKWLESTDIENDGIIRKDNDAKYYIFTEKSFVLRSQEKHTI